MPKYRAKRSKKRSFYGNRFGGKQNISEESDVASTVSVNEILTSSASKLNNSVNEAKVVEDKDDILKGNRIFDIETLISVFSILCCPVCIQTDLKLEEDSKFGLSSNFCLTCKCGFKYGFSSSPKKEKKNIINTLLVLGLRLIGKGYTAGKNLLLTLNLPCISKASFRKTELQLLEAVKSVAEQNMTQASEEVLNLRNDIACGVSVDGTWQRRGYSSLNGCVTAISIDTGKILDMEILSQYCYTCERSNNSDKTHMCSNHQGSAASMEVVGVYRIFERSVPHRYMEYTEYYGDGDSKGYASVKDIYGENTVVKLECIGHVQKRVGSRLRKLKKTKKELGGKGKLTDKFIDKLQNYYGIAIRSNVGNLENMQSAVIAAFFHCCSGKNHQMHGQCPSGSESWCRYQRALNNGRQILDTTPGIPSSIIKIIKPVYMSLCDRELLSKCLHGMTQNRNESFNNLLWTIVPKETFVGIETLNLGAHIALILFNSGFLGLLPVFEKLGLPTNQERVKMYRQIDMVRIMISKRNSLASIKIKRKKRRQAKKSKLSNYETKEGLSYKCGEF